MKIGVIFLYWLVNLVDKDMMKNPIDANAKTKSIYGANNKNLAHNIRNDGNKAHPWIYAEQNAINIPNIWNEISIYWFDNKYLVIGGRIKISAFGITGSGFCSIKNFESIIRIRSIEKDINLLLDAINVVIE